MPASLFYYGPLVKRLRQRPLTPLTWVRFPHGSPKNAPQLRLGSFFWCFRARNRTGRPPAGGKKQSCGLFFSPREMDARVTKKIPRKKLRGIFYCCFPGRQCAGGGASAERRGFAARCLMHEITGIFVACQTFTEHYELWYNALNHTIKTR